MISAEADQKEQMEASQSEAVNGGESEEAQPSVASLLAAAKATRQQERRQLVAVTIIPDWDVDSVLIEDLCPTETHVIHSGTRKFKVTSVEDTDLEAQTESPAFQVRRKSSIEPVSETVMTRSWLENAIRIHEDSEQVEIVNMRFDAQDRGVFLANLEAQVSGLCKTYDWIIKESPKKRIDYDSCDKDTFIVADLGTTLMKLLGKKCLPCPFQPVIYSDSEYAIFDNLTHYRLLPDDMSGLDLDCMRVVLRALARWHAITYAYFNSPKQMDSLQHFSDVIKFMINKKYQPLASAQHREQEVKRLGQDFEEVLQLLGQPELASKLRLKYAKSLFDIFKNAHDPSKGMYSVLCHGSPVQDNLRFKFDAESGKAVDVKLVNFQEACYAPAMNDVVMLMNACIHEDVQSQEEFLLRFVYFETLSATLKSMEPDICLSYEEIRADYQRKQLYGCLSASMHFARKVRGHAASATLLSRLKSLILRHLA